MCSAALRETSFYFSPATLEATEAQSLGLISEREIKRQNTGKTEFRRIKDRLVGLIGWICLIGKLKDRNQERGGLKRTSNIERPTSNGEWEEKNRSLERGAGRRARGEKRKARGERPFSWFDWPGEIRCARSCRKFHWLKFD